MKSEYCAGFIFDLNGNRVLLIEKKRPSWQLNKFNAIGGHIELNETPIKAMIREADEEVNLSITTWKHYLTLSDKEESWKVYWFYTFTNKISLFKNNTDESAEIFSTKLLPQNTISNIPYLMHAALNFERESADLLEVKEIYFD